MVVRILQVVNNMHRAGLETLLMNYYRKINREEIQFDFLTHRAESSDYDKEIEELGGKIYHAPRLYPQNYPEYFRYMDVFFKQHPEYKIIHSHIDTMSYLPLLAAKKADVPIRIAHSHNTSIDLDYKFVLKKYFKTKIKDVANEYCACGEDAGKFLFGNEHFEIIHNATNAKGLLFNATIRKKKRQDLGILEDEIIFGHVGRLSYQKNQDFLIKVFKRLKKGLPNCKLMIVGEGSKLKHLTKLVNRLGLSESVIFLGNRVDVNELYQAFDALLMPSRFEGIPMVGVEAQFADLPIFFSDRVSQEVAFTNNCSFLPLEASPEEWSRKILHAIDIKRQRSRKEQLLLTDYNIDNAYKALIRYYEKLLRDKQIAYS